MRNLLASIGWLAGTFIVLAIVVMVAIGSGFVEVKDVVLAPEVPEELRGSWVLEELSGSDVPEGAGITLDIERDKLSGYSGCNWYGTGDFSVRGAAVSVSMLESTAIGCPNETGRREDAYRDALLGAASYRLSGNRLELLDGEGRVTLVFTRR
jgi:heat shock protein HslJ